MKSLRGSSMVFAITLIAVVTLLLSSLMLVQSMDMTYGKLYSDKLDLKRNILSAINYYNEIDLKQDTLNVDLFGMGIDSVSIKRTSWGVIDLLFITAKRGILSDSGAVFLGAKREYSELLYLKDNGYPLRLGSEVYIDGNVAIPLAGIDRLDAHSAGYSPENSISGDISLSSEKLIFKREYLNSRISNFKRDLKYNDLRDLAELEIEEHVSFYDEQMIFYAKEKIVINVGQYSGHILFWSDTEIQIGSDANLSQVILMAPKVTIASNFIGNIQIIASKRIIIGENSILKWPSFIVLNNEDYSNSEECSVQLNQNSKVIGAVLDIGLNQNSRIQIAQKAMVQGDVISINRLMLEGEVEGRVEVKDFYYEKTGSYFKNQIRHAKILREKKPREVKPDLFDKGNTKPMLWVN